MKQDLNDINKIDFSAIKEEMKNIKVDAPKASMQYIFSKVPKAPFIGKSTIFTGLSLLVITGSICFYDSSNDMVKKDVNKTKHPTSETITVEPESVEKLTITKPKTHKDLEKPSYNEQTVSQSTSSTKTKPHKDLKRAKNKHSNNFIIKPIGSQENISTPIETTKIDSITDEKSVINEDLKTSNPTDSLKHSHKSIEKESPGFNLLNIPEGNREIFE